MYYLDNAATTKVCEKACEKAVQMMRDNFGNSSSVHKLGFEAEKEVRLAKEIILESLCVSEGEVVFTSGGTESNNLCIFGAVEQNKRFGKRIVTTAIEHSSVTKSMQELEKKGFEVIYLKPNEKGEITKEQLFEAITSDTILVSMMSVNNEIGCFLPLEYVKTAITRASSKAYFHVDHVQGFLKDKLEIKKLGIDLVSITAHKVHGLKGVGAVYLAKGKRIKPMIFGGEKSFRDGTLNTVGIASFGVAVKEYKKPENFQHIKQQLVENLKRFPQVIINSPEKSSDYILNISLGKIKGETMLNFLSERGIYVSTGSACNGSNLSEVLLNLGFDKERIETSIRISFCPDNTIEDIEALVQGLEDGFKNIAHV